MAFSDLRPFFGDIEEAQTKSFYHSLGAEFGSCYRCVARIKRYTKQVHSGCPLVNDCNLFNHDFFT